MSEKNKKTTDLNVGQNVDSTEAQEIENKNDGEESPTPCSVGDNESVDSKKGMLDLDRLRLSQDFASQVGVKKVITTVPCRKPNKHEFVRVHESKDYMCEIAVFEDKIGHETFIVDPNLYDELATEIKPICLFTTITRQNDLFLWPVKIATTDGKSNTWNDSALQAALLAQSKWIRVAANMNASAYDAFQANGSLSDPEWPEIAFEELFKLCFRDRFIESIDHPILRALRGEV